MTVMPSDPLEDRRLRFEAKRLALDTFVTIHIEHAEGYPKPLGRSRALRGHRQNLDKRTVRVHP